MKILFFSVFLLQSVYSFSQNKDFSIGLQVPFPTRGLSLKYDLDSVNQYQLSYTIFKDYSLNRNLVGWKYSRRLNKFKYFQSYSYIGLMLMTYKQLGYYTSDFGNEKNGTTISYGMGFGIRITAFHRFTVSLEGGGGKYNYNKANEDLTFVGGLGLHYHFRRHE